MAVGLAVGRGSPGQIGSVAVYAIGMAVMLGAWGIVQAIQGVFA